MYLGDATWPEVGEHLEDCSLALIPLGSTEQHGPHLPLSTDHVIAERFARAAAERGDYLATPTVTVGVSSHHRQFHGTLSIEPAAFRDYVASIVRSLASHGVDRAIFVNAHGGNVQHLREVGRRLHADETAYAVEWMWDHSIPDRVDAAFEHNGPHAGPKETSLIWHLIDGVRTEQLAAGRDGGLVDLGSGDTRRHGARTYFDAIESSPNGAYGDPTEASVEAGAELFEAALDELLALCEWLAAQPWEALAPKEHVRTRSDE